MEAVRRFRNIVCTKYGLVLINFAIITIIALIIFRNFFLTSNWPGGGDTLGAISGGYIFGKDFRWLYVWRPQSFGCVEPINLMDSFLMLIHSVCLDAAVTTKIFMFFSFLMAGFSMYAFSHHYTHNHIAALSASLVYTLNQWFFSQFTEGHTFIIFSYALAPLLFLLLDRALETRKSKDILALALIFAIFLTSFDPGSVVIYGVFLSVFVIFYVLQRTNSINFRTRVKHLLKVFLPAGIISFLIAAPRILPLMSNVAPPYFSPQYKYYLEETFTGSYKNITDAFSLRGLEQWGYIFKVDVTRGLGLPGFPTQAFLLCLFFLAYCTILFHRDRYTYFFAFSALISIIISMGPYSPFGNVFVWAWFNVPYFSVFRATSRWIMMTAFSHSFFISVLGTMIANYLQKRRHVIVDEDFRARKTMSKELRDYLAPLVSLYRNLHKFLYYLGIIALALILLTGFFSCFFFFDQGLQVYTPPQTYIEPYEWIAEQPGDYKIVAVNRSPGEWYESPGAATDFGFSGMLTDLGWGHDIGQESSFIHDKPVLQDGGWSPLSKAFVNFLRFRLARDYMTDDILKMLGAFNYRYIVLPPYASANIRNFFLKQQGANIVYNQSGSIIIDDYYYTPHIFASTQHAVVLGGLESFPSLCKIDSFNLDQKPLIFAHQISNSPLFTDSAFNSSEALFFVNTDILDMVMLSLRGDVNLVNAADYSAPSLDNSKYWTRESFWSYFGGLVLGGDTLTTLGANSVDIPFRADSAGAFDIWIRVGFAPSRGKLKVSVDHTLIGEICPESNFWAGLKWINVTRLDLESGTHVMTLTNDGSGFNDVDAITAVKPSLLQSRTSEVLEALQAFSGRLVYLIESESIQASGWSLTSAPYNGVVLHSEGRGSVISYGATASASSFESEGLEAQKAIDGSIYTRWASSQGLPQWLQIDWPTIQELRGAHIVFENAYAEDYAIQTWNGTDWVDQVQVKGNTLLEQFHDFPCPVSTTKMRLYVTAAPAFNMVSVWELEPYSTQAVSTATKIFTPRRGKYMIAARLASGPDYKIFELKINNTDFTVSCSSSETGFKWYEFGPVFLDVGEQEIGINAFGKADLDTIIIYSLKDGETTLPSNDLFKPDNTPPSITYEKINSCKYVVHVDSSDPFLLIFSDSYHPLWRAYVDGTETSPVTAYSVVNGFFINKTGEFDITLYFTAQTYADIGIKISLVTLIIVIVAIAIPSDTIKRIVKFIKRKLTGVYVFVQNIMRSLDKKLKEILTIHNRRVESH